MINNDNNDNNNDNNNNAKVCLVGNCKNTEKSVRNVRREYSVSLWSFVVTRLAEEMTVITTART